MLDEAARERLVTNITNHLKAGVQEPVLSRALQYWTNVDADLGARVTRVMKGERQLVS